MRLRNKLTLILLAGSLFSFVLGGGLFAWRMQEFYVRNAAESYGKQIDSIRYVFSESVLDSDLGQMGELAMEAYLKFQFKRCFGEGYALLKEDEAIVNLTEFEIRSAALESDYVLQNPGNRTVLLLKREFEQLPGYGVLCTQDISSWYEDMRRQIREAGIIFGVILALTGAAASWLIGRVLRPLRELAGTAAEFGNGSMTARAEISAKDETGELAAAFNVMADRVERQVDDLHLLLGALTHEIKTPMTSIIGYSDTLLRVKLSEDQQRRALENINHAGRRLERLSVKMLALLGSYRTEELSLGPCGIGETVRRAMAELDGAISQKRLRIELDGDPDRAIMADGELMTALVENLLSNAIKASEPGGRVVVRWDAEGLSVTDEGCGIPADALPHVKEAFYMADKSRSRSEGGSGLGLALCDRIAALHGMRLELRSEEGKGTEAVLAFTKRLHSDEDSAGEADYNGVIKGKGVNE